MKNILFRNHQLPHGIQSRAAGSYTFQGLLHFLQVRPLSPQFLYTPDGHCIWKAHAGYGLKIPLRPTQNDARKNWLKSQFFSGAACPIFREFLTLPHKYKNQAL